MVLVYDSTDRKNTLAIALCLAFDVIRCFSHVPQRPTIHHVQLKILSDISLMCQYKTTNRVLWYNVYIILYSASLFELVYRTSISSNEQKTKIMLCKYIHKIKNLIYQHCAYYFFIYHKIFFNFFYSIFLF